MSFSGLLCSLYPACRGCTRHSLANRRLVSGLAAAPCNARGVAPEPAAAAAASSIIIISSSAAVRGAIPCACARMRTRAPCGGGCSRDAPARTRHPSRHFKFCTLFWEAIVASKNRTPMAPDCGTLCRDLDLRTSRDTFQRFAAPEAAQLACDVKPNAAVLCAAPPLAARRWRRGAGSGATERAAVPARAGAARRGAQGVGPRVAGGRAWVCGGSAGEGGRAAPRQRAGSARGGRARGARARYGLFCARPAERARVLCAGERTLASCAHCGRDPPPPWGCVE